MRVEPLARDPEVLLVHDFVTEAETDALVRAANFQRSATTCVDKAIGCVSDYRTSWSAYLPSSPTTRAVTERGIDLSLALGAEDLQVVRYEPGQEFRPHLDAVDPNSVEGKRELTRFAGRQRYATLLIYLAGPEAGGATVFPVLGLTVQPRRRAAVFWRNLLPDGARDRRTLHAGAPVRRGVKYAANLWLRGDGRVQRNGQLAAPRWW